MVHWAKLVAAAMVAATFLGALFVVSRGLAILFRRVGAGPIAIKLVPYRLVAVVGAYVFTVASEQGQMAASAVGSQLAAVAVNALVASAVAVLGLMVVSRGFRPFVTGLHAGNVTVPKQFRRQHRLLMFAAAFAVALVVEAVRLQVVTVSPAWILVAIAVVWAVFLFRTAHLRFPPLGTYRLRDPTGEERTRIENCCERFGRSPERILVVDDDDPAIDANVLGRGAYKTVGVTEQFLARVDDTTLAVTLAHADGRSGNGYWTLLTCVTVYAFLMLLLIFIVFPALLLELLNPQYPWVWVVMILVVPFPVFFLLTWLSRRSVLDADAFVASQFDTSTVATVYRQSSEYIRYQPVLPRVLNSLIGFEPAMAARLERLGIESSSETATRGERDAATTDGDVDGTARDDKDQSDRDQDVSQARNLDSGWRRWLLAATALAALSPVASVAVTTLVPPSGTGSGLGPLTFVVLTITMVAGLTTFLTWVLIPLFIYLDSAATRSATGWPSYRVLYFAGGVIPFFNVLTGVVYLWRRPTSGSVDYPVEPGK